MTHLIDASRSTPQLLTSLIHGVVEDSVSLDCQLKEMSNKIQRLSQKVIDQQITPLSSRVPRLLVKLDQYR
jgi:hypothetical protein